MKKCFVLCLLLAFAAVVLGQSCQSKVQCGFDCPDGYHAECKDRTCQCPTRDCSAAKDCDHSSGSGCPPFFPVDCVNKKCICKRP